MLSSLVASNKGHGSDVFVGANVVHCGHTTVDDVDNTIRDTGLFKQVNADFGSSWDSLGGFKDKGVSESD